MGYFPFPHWELWVQGMKQGTGHLWTTVIVNYFTRSV